jgi:hypothetical protein
MRYLILLLLAGCSLTPTHNPETVGATGGASIAGEPLIRAEYPKAPCEASKQRIEGNVVHLGC